MTFNELLLIFMWLILLQKQRRTSVVKNKNSVMCCYENGNRKVQCRDNKNVYRGSCSLRRRNVVRDKYEGAGV